MWHWVEKWANSFLLEGLECPDLVCKPQCVPAEQDRDILMFPLFWKFYLSMLQHRRLCTWLCSLTHTYTHRSFFHSFWKLFLQICDHPICSSPLPHLFQPITPSCHWGVQENKTSVILNWNLYFSFLFNSKKTKNEVKTDGVVCCRHANQLYLFSKSGCDIL